MIVFELRPGMMFKSPPYVCGDVVEFYYADLVISVVDVEYPPNTRMITVLRIDDGVTSIHSRQRHVVEPVYDTAYWMQVK